jgi:hypothetical protein
VDGRWGVDHLEELQPDVLIGQAVEQPGSRAEQHRHHMQHELVQEALGQELSGEAGSTGHADGAVARRGPRLLDRLGDRRR